MGVLRVGKLVGFVLGICVMAVWKGALSLVTAHVLKRVSVNRAVYVFVEAQPLPGTRQYKGCARPCSSNN
jgi:hypothetical protein